MKKSGEKEQAPDLEEAIASVVTAVSTMIKVAVAEEVARSMPKKVNVSAPATVTPRDTTPRLITLNDVVKLVSLSRAMVNKLRAQGKFPRSVSLGDRRVAFVRQEVQDWIDERISRRK
jgi:prophage regulatory protein